MLVPLLLTLLAGDPWADQVVAFEPGVGGSAGFDDPTSCLGPPERFSGEAGGTPGVVSPFAPAWGTDELVSIGLGGRIVLAFDEPVTDDPDNPFGIDLLVLGNTGLVDGSWPEGICTGIFGADGGVVEVSADGVVWYTVDVEADAPWPTVGFRDAGPYDTAPGTKPTDPLLPVDPELHWSMLMGLPHEEILDLYAGSAGGTGIDLANVGLASISQVRISVPDDAFVAPEVEALVDVGRWGDATGDHAVDVEDVLAVVGAWGAPGPALADRNHDGTVGVSDLLIVLETWQ